MYDVKLPRSFLQGPFAEKILYETGWPKTGRAMALVNVFELSLQFLHDSGGLFSNQDGNHSRDTYARLSVESSDFLRIPSRQVSILRLLGLLLLSIPKIESINASNFIVEDQIPASTRL